MSKATAPNHLLVSSIHAECMFGHEAKGEVWGPMGQLLDRLFKVCYWRKRGGHVSLHPCDQGFVFMFGYQQLEWGCEH